MPQSMVGCIRVTHPCAGRRQVLLLSLPLDLHVLGLPLAFILSQDQTLHCKCKILLCLSDLLCTTTFMIMDTLLLRLYFNLFKELISISHLFFKRAAKLILFLILQNFFLKSFSIFPELFPI